MKKLLIIAIACSTLGASAQEVIQWRGTDRTGVYKETGLMKTWPQEGPAMLWHYDSLGEGHSSVAIANNKIYVTGLVDGNGHVFVFDMNGKLLRKRPYGPEWSTNYNGARGTVTISDGKIYLYSGAAELYCLDETTLDVIWKKSSIDDFKGSNLRFGVNESPLVVGDKVFITPGGETHNFVALNKNTGAVIWSCPGDGDLSAYCSPLYISDQEVPQVVTIMGKHVMGVDIRTGKKLWSFANNNNRNIHPNTPLYSDNMLLCAYGYGKGTIMLRLTNGGRNIEKVWENTTFDPKTGGAVKLGNYVYASGDHNKYWFCLDWKSGEQQYSDKTIGVGAVIAAEGMLYCYSEKGEMALARATPEKFDLISKFMITLGTEQHWAHPVIYNGVLYVRHGNTLMAYNIKQK